MPGARDIIRAVHASVVWLSMMFVFCGPLGLGAQPAVASACPCDEDEHDDCDDEHDEGAPSNDECPEDCTSCGCGTVVAVAIVASTIAATALPSSPDLQLAPPDSAAAGVRTGVFRPPRSLT